MQQRVLGALDRAAAAGTIPEEIGGYYLGMLGWHPGGAPCDWLRNTATGDQPALIRAWAYRGLATCEDPALAEMFARDDAPDQAVIDWYFERMDGQPPPFTERLAKAASGVAAGGNDHQAREIGFALAHTADERAVTALIALQETIADPVRRALVALGMLEHPSPAGRELGRAACAQLADRRDPMCDRGDPPDRPAEVTAQTPLAPLDPAIATRLTDLGFPPRADPEATMDLLPGVDGALIARGYASEFDTETDQFPNEHDGLMADLAFLVRPELDAALFEEIAPSADDPDGSYLLRAYVGGKRYEVDAVNLGDWYDLGAVVGLLNAVLVTRGSDWRLVTLRTGGQGARVLAGREHDLRALVDAGMITLGRPDAAMDIGKDGERRVFEQLEREGR
jgi:hypothetical protein